MSVLDVMRHIQSEIGGDPVVKLEVGDYEQSSLMHLSETQSRIVIIKDDAFLSWVVDDGEWENPQPLIEQILSEAPQMIKTHNHYAEHPEELMAELVKKVNRA